MILFLNNNKCIMTLIGIRVNFRFLLERVRKPFSGFVVFNTNTGFGERRERKKSSCKTRLFANHVHDVVSCLACSTMDLWSWMQYATCRIVIQFNCHWPLTTNLWSHES